MTNPTPHGQVPDTLIDLIDTYAETRHRCGGIYNARTEAARKAVIEALSGVQALSAAPAEQQAAPKAAPTRTALPEGWTDCTIEFGNDGPEVVAYGPKRMMTRLAKWLGKYFAQVIADAAPKAAPQQEAQEPAVDDPTRWLTVVYRDISPGDEARLLAEHPKASAMSWSHAIRDRDAARAVLAKWGTQPQAGAVPQGWKAVPVNPTPEMWKAAKSVPDPNPPYPPHYGLVWDAMLAASPTPTAEQQAAPKAAPVKACVCGEPQSSGTVHRVNGPCYVAAPQQEPATAQRFNCWSTNEGDSWFDHPADAQAIYDCLGNDAKVGDEYELTAGWKSVTARYRITEVVGDGEEYEVECVSHPHENSAPQPAPHLPERDASLPAERQGLFRKFVVGRVDGSDKPGGKHHGCTYFVLDVDHDPCARPALAAYAAACESTHPTLAADLRTKWGVVPAPQPAPAPLSDDVVKDAARYRWLREGNDAKHGAAWHVAVNLYGCEWDAAIDAALAAQGGE